MRPSVVPLLLLALSLAACGDDPADSPYSPRGYDALSYRLRARFDWSTRQLIASEEITLALAPGADPIVELDSDVTIGAITSGDTPLTFTVDGSRLRVDLAPVAGANPIVFTVDYQAPTSGSLIAAVSRDADPVTSRVVYTDSEPDRGRGWLVASHRPDDRARFGVELTLDADEDLIANGTRVRDEPTAGGRIVGYLMDDPIPTYLMAFAGGQLEHHDRERPGRAPLSVWHRRGLFVEAERHLDIVAEAMEVYEALLGPYPFDRYSVVLLPLMGGGMENAGITFNIETSGQGAISFSLNAHELGHQWFGDWVTVESFDDLWIKEGMATLLATEAARARRDGERRGRLFGFDYPFDPDDAIRDLTLPLLARYTSGPYERAAWLLTQIRVKVGEGVFWNKLHRILDEHALGTVDSETFVRSFGPELDAASIRQALDALEAKGAPEIVIATPAPGTFNFTVVDPDRLLLVPIEVTTVDGDGRGQAHTLGERMVQVRVPDDGYLAIDERDIHPNWPDSFVVDNTAYFQLLAPRLVPADLQALAAFEMRSASAQERALWPAVSPFGAEGLPGFYDGLDSTLGRFYAEIVACRQMRSMTDKTPWMSVLPAILRTPGLTTISTGYAACGPTLGQQVFATELAALAADPASSRGGRIGYVMNFDFGAGSFEPIARIATTAPSMPIREQAIVRLSFQAQSGNGYSAVPAEQVPAWKSFFRDRLPETTSFTRFRAVWRGVRGLRDDGALGAAGAALQRVPMTAESQEQVICQAYALATDVPAAWDAFKLGAEPHTRLSAAAQEALNDPATACAP